MIQKQIQHNSMVFRLSSNSVGKYYPLSKKQNLFSIIVSFDISGT